MSVLYDKIAELCSLKGISGYKLCKETGLQPSAITDLKMGRKKTLSADSAEKIARYFGVSVGYLLGTEEKEKPAENGGLVEYLTELRDRPETRALLEASRGMTKEQVEAMADFARRLRGTND